MQWDNVPGGGGSGREFTPDDLLNSLRRLKPASGKIGSVVLALLAVVAVLWLASGIYIVGADQEGVVKRFGKVTRTTGPGPHYHLPFPIETVLKPRVTKVFRTEIGFRTVNPGPPARYESVPKESHMLTGDENIVSVEFIVQYKIQNSFNYLFKIREADETLRASAEAAMREVIGTNRIDRVLTAEKSQIQIDAADLLQQILDSYDAGLKVVEVKLQDVLPPKEVMAAFKDVASAREDRVKLTNQAEGYRADLLPKAQGQAAQLVAEAEAYSSRRVKRAEGDAERFNRVVTEYLKAKDVTRQRLYLETMELIISRVDRVILDEKAGSRALPLLSIGKQDAAVKTP